MRADLIDSGGPSRRREREWIRAAREGSEQAVDALFRAHWPRAYRAAQMIVRDPGAAEDIAQEAFLAALRRLEQFDRRRPFGPWLHRIAVNRAIDHTRARRLRRESGGGALQEAERERIGDAAGDPARDGGGDDALSAAVARLSDEHRAVVAMRFVLELTPGEIARELGLPRGTVNSRLRRALDRLAADLEDAR